MEKETSKETRKQMETTKASALEAKENGKEEQA